MALEVYESQETRSAANSGGKATGSRKFTVFDEAAAVTTPATIRAAFGTAGIPDIGDKFDSATSMYAVGYAIRHLPNSRNLWEVEFQYENTEPGRFLPQEVGYTEVSIEWSAELRDMWRTTPGLVFPTNGSPSATERLCGGRRIDTAGVPMSVLHRTSTITFSETVDSQTVPIRSLAIRDARGKRNSSVFQGAPVGQVLYVGASATRVAIDKYSIVHRFAQDAHYHMLQSPERGPDGQVTHLTADETGLLRADGVFWVQPFGEFADFNALSENF